MKALFFILFYCLTLTSQSGCAQSTHDHTVIATASEETQEDKQKGKQALPIDTYTQITLSNTLLDKPSAFLNNLPRTDLEMVATEARRATLSNWQSIDKRGQLVRHRMLKLLESMDAPQELLFVPVAESGYNPYALSPAGAFGLWQLMPRTAIELGALHRHGIDGRRDVEQSTKAAISYLLSLHKRFDSWTLALAAYNLGPWGVQRRLNKQPWQPEMGLNALPFPAETRHYVKQILGMVALQEQGELTFSPPIETQAYRMSKPIDISQVEKLAGLEKHALFRLNPGLDYQHYLNRHVNLHLPVGNILQLEQALISNPDALKPKFIHVRVKNGDSLWKIAHKHHTSIAYLRKLNPKLKPTLSIGQKVTVPASNSFATASHKLNPLLSQGRRIRYKVKSGDSLWKIAKKFGTSTRAIARANQMSLKKLLRPGDRLWIIASIQPS